MTPARAGTRLGPYEILSSLGAGGMGEVFRARDTRLNREVAIKVSREQFSERSAREARAVAALNHPNICTLHDVGPNYLVMELVEGPTLADRMKEGPVPIEEALAIARQIAEALEAAHEKGIVHRDLKPANIKLTPNGSVKVLDFGLAKRPVEETEFTADSPTMLSATGMILGTAGYMAPEQAKGKPVDKRADIFAFGVVLYEMVTGQRLFAGETISDALASIIKDEPDWKPVPARLQRVLRKCLEKDRNKRLRDIGDWELLLEDERNQIRHATKSSPVSKILWIVATAALALAAGALAFVHFREKPTPQPSIRFPVSLPDPWTLSQLPDPLTVSPDGSRIALIGENEGKRLLWVRTLDTLNAQPLTGTEGVTLPFWSPDSRSLGFFANGKLKRIDVSGGPPTILCDATGPGGGAWSPDGVIVFNEKIWSGLSRVSASGGVPVATTVLAPDERAHVDPLFLPDGRHFVYQALVGSVLAPAFLASLGSSERKLLLNVDATNTRYSLGYLLFPHEGRLMAQRFDMRRLALSGEPVPVAESVHMLNILHTYAVFGASENGLLAFQAESAEPSSRLIWVDRAGRPQGSLGDSANFSNDLALSPDGKWVAVSILDKPGRGRDIWIYDVARGFRTRFTFDAADATAPVWSPDGRRLAFTSRRNGHLDLYEKAFNGTDTEQLLLKDAFDKFPMSWSVDGQFLLYRSRGPAKDGLFVLPLSKDHAGSFALASTPSSANSGQFSPDGRWVAYCSNESGRPEVYVMPFRGDGAKSQISTAGGCSPSWDHAGKEIFFVDLDLRVTAAKVNGKSPSLRVESVKPLFRLPDGAQNGAHVVSPDGKRFLLNISQRQTAAVPITVVTNWASRLSR